ncbi:hypothetical protein L21SP2_1297 [Salinispira pacifica]|uniref:Uncharacterized protein n=1 Tax=Salinispira pacifica TaxID=1307761 RepID=V5WFX5_9SPIO|nr:hypothetical protein L21SP2_1297 [Salinispira pacifica]
MIFSIYTSQRKMGNCRVKPVRSVCNFFAFRSFFYLLFSTDFFFR